MSNHHQEEENKSKAEIQHSDSSLVTNTSTTKRKEKRKNSDQNTQSQMTVSSSSISKHEERLPFPRFGEKLDQKSTLPQEQINQMINERKNILFQLLKVDRQRREKDISIGEFIPEENAVKTIQMKGKIGSDMGFTIRKENLCERIRKNPTVYVEGLDEKLIIRQDSENAFRFLHIEEALYLIDVGSLILIVEKEPYQLCHLEIQEKKVIEARVGYLVASVQEAFALFIRHSSISKHFFRNPEDLINSFLAYSYLKKLGFSIQRHDKDREEKKKKKQLERQIKYKKQKEELKNNIIDTTHEEDISGEDQLLPPQTSNTENEKKKRKIDNTENLEKPQLQSFDTPKVITSKQQNKANSRVLWSTFEWFSQQTANDEFHDAISPLIYNLELKDEQLLEQQQLFNTLNIIKCGLCSYSSPMRDVMNTTTSADSSSSTDMMDFSTHSTEGTIKAFEPIMFDVWKPGVSLNDSPSMIIIVTSFSNSTVPTINDIFKVSEQGARFNQIPIFHCVIGESGSVMFMNLCPCEIENLLLTPLMPSQATSDTTTTMTTMLPSDHTDQYNRE
ncbi:hypothetical protein FDP41_012211 [Naegleria fowleri]|uniref:tRNA-splicing endonuclease subunit Sen54 N-terminal domain-containing protein n=1 Tax=Naegleria fowleri TaxID=5763 RepID=A0A6A5C512_NAEFO|nr:uncharacterized protein FDP41_012211 [Naegleria fowleri]KAF0981554.1 hypothetical protein FDP41_012211 [Naegleria fowleri]